MTISGAGPRFRGSETRKRREVAEKISYGVPITINVLQSTFDYRSNRKISIKKVSHFDVDHLFLKIKRSKPLSRFRFKKFCD